MDRTSLTTNVREITVNDGAADGATDIFSYELDESATHGLGSLFVVGHRTADSGPMGYMVSLVAAMARREYYAQPGIPPRDAFARTLRKLNEVIDEFFKSGGEDLSAGVVAVVPSISGGMVMVAKLNGFKILLARDGETVDILNNVALFSKEHLDQRRFSNIISGSIQSGDRLLAYIPTKAGAAKDRSLKTWFLKLDPEAFEAQVASAGRKQPGFAASLLHIDLGAPTVAPEVAPEPLPAPVPELSPEPTLATSGPVVWSPRQHGHPTPITKAATVIPERKPTVAEEVPHIIPTEFSLATRRNPFSKWFSNIRFVELNSHGKAIALGAAALVVIVGVVGAKSMFFASPTEQRVAQVVKDAENDLKLARSKVAQNQESEARGLIIRALASLAGQNGGTVRDLSANLLSTLDGMDNAHTGITSLIAQSESNDEKYQSAVWASGSHSLWASGAAGDAHWVARLEDGTAISRTDLGTEKPDILIPFHDGIMTLDLTNRSLTRMINGELKTVVIPTQEAIQDAAEYSDALYVLTDASILKVTDLDTNAPVTKQWLADSSEFATGAARLTIDGSIHVMNRDGALTTYYKGKKSYEVSSGLSLAGQWRLLPGSTEGELIVAVADTRRVHVIDAESGELKGTTTLETDQKLISVGAGPDGSIFTVTADGRIWKLE